MVYVGIFSMWKKANDFILNTHLKKETTIIWFLAIECLGRDFWGRNPGTDYAGAEKYRAGWAKGSGKGKTASFRGSKACRGRQKAAGAGVWGW